MKESSLESVPPSERGCLYAHEMDEIKYRYFFAIDDKTDEFGVTGNYSKSPHVLGEYSQNGCYYECLTEGTLLHMPYVFAEPCFPWNYPINPFIAHPNGMNN